MPGIEPIPCTRHALCMIDDRFRYLYIHLAKGCAVLLLLLLLRLAGHVHGAGAWSIGPGICNKTVW